MPSRRPRRVGLLTGGGDCPWEVWGIEDGFDGLLTRDVRRLTGRDVRGILQLGTRFGAAAMRMVAEAVSAPWSPSTPRKSWPCRSRGRSGTVG